MTVKDICLLFFILHVYYKTNVYKKMSLKTPKTSNTLSNCPGGHPVLHMGLKLNSKISADKY